MKIIIHLSFLIYLFLCSNSMSQSYWDQTNGPYGGDIRSITINSVGILFAATDYAGTYRSFDNGEHWEQINNGLPLNYAQSLVVNSQNQLFAGHKNNGIYRSSDNGETWFVKNNGLTSTMVNYLAANSNDELFAATLHGMFRSADNGENWLEINNGLGNDEGFVTSIAITPQGVIFLGINQNDTFGSIYRSTDDGNNWVEVVNGIDPFESGIVSIAANSQGYIFAGTWGYGIYRSTDSGENWTQVVFGSYPYVKCFAVKSNDDIYAGTISGVYKSTNDGVSWDPAGSALSQKYLLSLLSTPQDDIYAGLKYGCGIYHSADNGNTWTQINEGITGVYLLSLTVSPDNSVFAGSYGGIYRSTDAGASWNQVNSGLDYPWVISLAADPDGYIFAATILGGGIFRSTNNGNSWSQVNNGLTDPYIYSLSITPEGNILAGSSAGVLFCSTNSGSSWTAMPVGSSDRIYAIAADSGSIIYCGLAGSGIRKSTNNGQNWLPVNSGILSPYDIRTLIIDSYHNVYAGSIQRGIYLTTNGGSSWSQVNNGISSLDIYSLCINSAGDIFAGAGNGIFHSTDSGSSWQDISEGLSDTHVFNIGINSGNYLYAATVFGGVYKSQFPTPVELTSFTAEIKGTYIILNWQTSSETNNRGFEIERQFISPMGSCKWATIGFVNGSGTTASPKSYLFTDRTASTGTYNYRLKQIDFDGSFKYTGEVEIEFNSSGSYTLNQNYPNPFNPSTNIEFSIPRSEFVTLKVYDVLGNEAAALINEVKPAGTHTIKFDGSRLASGMYFYKIQTGSFSQIRKMILLK